MNRKPVRWADALKHIFSPVRKKRNSTRLAVEEFESRTVPAVITVTSLVDGAVGSLRDAITTANTNSDATNTIQLASGATYTLTLANGGGGQENANALGDLDIFNGSSLASKSYIIVGLGAGATIDANFLDRVFHIIGSDVSVTFQSVTIINGIAFDDGTATAAKYSTDSYGGGILNQGGAVTFQNVRVINNEAQGGVGLAGLFGADATISASAADGSPGGNGRSAFGGGLYSTAGAIVVGSGSSFTNNRAIAGDGGAGGDGGDKTNSAFPGNPGAGGAGGAGGNAGGGAIWLVTGTLTVSGASTINQNSDEAGTGGAGGAGGNTANTALGIGGAGGAGGLGGWARGGGIYVGTGTLTINGSSNVIQNVAYGGFGGDGGNGGAGSNPGGSGGGGSGGAGGVGGNAGAAGGGGIYVASGNITIDGSSHVDANIASAGIGGNGGNGGNGIVVAGNGAAGGNGAAATGGGIYAGNGTVLINNNSTVNANFAFGGTGGAGGGGGAGGITAGAGGNGGTGGDAAGGGIYVVTGLATGLTLNNGARVSGNTANAGVGGDGGNGGPAVTFAGDGGNGGSGGNARGGGIYVGSGNVRVQGGSRVNTNQARADIGGNGGNGGSTGFVSNAVLGDGGNGGAGGSAFGGGIYAGAGNVLIDTGSSVNSNLATGNSGAASGGAGGNALEANGAAGNGGNGGSGINAFGGGIYALSGNVTIQGASSLSNNLAKGRDGGNGGPGGSATEAGGVVGNGGVGGAGGTAFGGGIYAGNGTVTINTTSLVLNNRAWAGNGGNGGVGGLAVNSATGAGGAGGAGGNGGAAGGGALYVVSGTVSIQNSSRVNGNRVDGGNGGNGGNGGSAFTGGVNGGAGGAGGNGANAAGGAIWIQTGNVTIDRTAQVNTNVVFAGNGGGGGNGGNDPSGSGAGGAGGAAGNGGHASGGGIFANSGTVTVTNSSFVTSNSAFGGNGGLGGGGGFCTGNPGGAGGAGGAGGNAQGGGIFANSGAVTISIRSGVNNNGVSAGVGGNGGNGGAGGLTGGNGGVGGTGGNGQGGGIYAGAGAVTINSSQVNGNFAGGADGGDGGNANSTAVGGNGGDGGDSQGGGIYVGTGSATLDTASIDGNTVGNSPNGGDAGTGGGSANGGAGGDLIGAGIYTSNGASALTIRNSSVTNNSAGSGSAGNGGVGFGGGNNGIGGNVLGGGIYVGATTALISNSTIGLNDVGPAGAGNVPGVSRGGGVFIASGKTVTIRNSTVSYNTSNDQGGGIRNQGTLSLVSSLVSNNISLGTAQEDLSNTGTATASNSFLSTFAGHTIANNFTPPNTLPAGGNIVGLPNLPAATGDPALFQNSVLTPALNGTQFFGFFGPSVVFNKGTNPANLATDQRGPGFPRTTGGQTDIGAIEADGGTTAPSVVAISTANGAVRLINPSTGLVIQSFRPFDTANSKYNGVVNVAVGDVNGDGYADIIVATSTQRNQNLNARVKVYDGFSAFQSGVDFSRPSTWINPANGTSRLGPANNPGSYLNPAFAWLEPFAGYTGGLTLASGDVNNDGFSDIIAGTTAGVPSRVAVFSGASPLTRIGNVITPFGNQYTGGVSLAAGDVNGDKQTELIVGTASRFTRIQLYNLTGATFTKLGAMLTPFGTANTGVQVTTVDTAGTGVPFIAAATLNSSGTVQVNVINAAGTTQGSYTQGTGLSSFGIGHVDVNQDKVQELMIGLVPSTGTQVSILNALTGAGVGAFNAFATLIGGVSLDGF